MPGIIKVSSQQPLFLGWCGFWNKVIEVDVMILVGGVELSLSDYVHRVKLHGSWMGAILSSRKSGVLVAEHSIKSVDQVIMRIQNELMVKRYKYHNRLEPVLTILRGVVSGETPLFFLNTELILAISGIIGIKTKFIRDIKKQEGSSKTVKLKHRVESKVEAPFVYYMGRGALDYLDVKCFTHNVMLQSFNYAYDTDTVLEALAREPDIYDYLVNFAHWGAV